MRKLFKLLPFVVVLFGSFSVPLVCGNKTGFQQKKRHKCEYCVKSFSDKKYLNLHIRNFCKKSPNAQNRTGRTGYPCEYCGKSFSKTSHLNRHIRDFCKEKNEGADPQDSVLGKRKRPIRARPVRIKQERGNSIATTTACINYLLEAAKDSEIRIKQEPVSDEERDLEPQLKRQKLWHENKD